MHPGKNRADLLKCVLFQAFIGCIFLGEETPFLWWCGTMLIICGLIIISYQQMKSSKRGTFCIINILLLSLYMTLSEPGDSILLSESLSAFSSRSIKEPVIQRCFKTPLPPASEQYDELNRRCLLHESDLTFLPIQFLDSPVIPHPCAIDLYCSKIWDI